MLQRKTPLKRPHKPIGNNPCKYCGSALHTSLMCLRKPRRALNAERPSTKSKRTMVSREWFDENPPDERGRWVCYLNISPECPHYVTRSTINLEHVRSKARHPELKYDKSNLKPSCNPCNKLKGSKDIEDLVPEYPHLAVYVS